MINENFHKRVEYDRVQIKKNVKFKKNLLPFKFVYCNLILRRHTKSIYISNKYRKQNQVLNKK